jgi:beta-lactamase class A
MGEIVVAVGAGTTSLGVWLDGRFLRAVRVRRAPARLAVPLPVGLHDVRLRARGAGGARWAPARSTWVLPRSAQRARGIGGSVDPALQRDLRAVTARMSAMTGVYVQHLVTGCGGAVNAGAPFPAASTLKAAILLHAVRRGSPEVGDALLDRMIVNSDDSAANRALEILGGGSGVAGSQRVTGTLRAMGLSQSLVRRPYIIETNALRRSDDIPVRTERRPALFTNFISTPYELARIMVAIHRGMRGQGPLPGVGVSSRTLRTRVVPRLLRVRDRSKLVAGAPAGVLVAHKSGYTTNVKHDAGVMYLASGPVVVVAMSWSAAGVGDGVGNGFVAEVARVAAARLRGGGRCATAR